MSDLALIVDCSDDTGSGHALRPLTDEESAARTTMLAELEAAGQKRDQQAAAQQAAAKQVKQLAKQGKPIDAATFAQLVGIDVNAPDPAQPAA